MVRVPALFAAGLLAATIGSAAGQAPVAPIATSLPPAASFVPPAPFGFAGGFQSPVQPSGGYVLPAYGGYYFAPTMFPFANSIYPSYSYNFPGLYGGVGGYPGLNTGGVPPATGLVGVNVGPTPVETAPRVIPLQPSIGVNNPLNVALSGEQSATLVVALPSSGDVWLGGVRQKESGATYTLTSPVLQLGESHKFDVRAEWLVNGKRYRADRTVSVGVGDRQRLTLVLGDPVK